MFIFKNIVSLTTIVITRAVSLQTRKFRNSAAMSHPKRYFVNNLQDYAGGNSFTEQDLSPKIHQTIMLIVEQQPPNVRDADGGLYVGIAGIGYMFYHLSRSQIFASEKSIFLKKGLDYIVPSLDYAEHHKNDKSQKSAFLLGNAGVYAVAAALYHESAYIESCSNCKPLNFLKCGGDELFVGRAGYLSGILWLQKIFGNGFFPEQDIFVLCKCIVESGRKYAQHYKSPCPLMYAYYDVEYLGAAHGLCAILQMLLSFPNYLKSDPRAEQDVKASVDYLLSLQTRNGNFPCATDELGNRARPESEELEEKYLRSCLKCGELVWAKGLLRKGPGTCHGVAGSGYVFLLLYRLTGDPKHLHRAQAFASFIFSPEFTQGAKTPDSPYSLYEGLAGTVCYLSDVLKPDQAAFPFLDVF
ncbi:LanC-like protein 3 [Blattella germanica]|nr:LanC-like protein 3 [Blattella germanica]